MTDTNFIEFALSEPLKTHDGEVSVLKLKPPRARSFIKHEVPFKLVPRTDADGDVSNDLEFNAKAMMGFAADMSGLDDIILQNMHGFDTWKLFHVIAGYIGNPPKRGG